MRRKRRLRKQEQAPAYRAMQRASVNVYKTENSYEMLVFAPGRIKEHFHLDVKGSTLTVSCTLPHA